MDLAKLTIATFEPLVGHVFTVPLGDALPELRLRQVRPLGASPGGASRAPFSLLFEAEGSLLGQRIYPLRHEQLGVLELFLVPLGPAGDLWRYEAVFT